jgi:hypothetical protein
MTEIIANAKYMNVDQYRSRKSTVPLVSPAAQLELDNIKAKQSKHLLIEAAACRAGNNVLQDTNHLMTYDSIHLKNTSLTSPLPLIETLYLSSCLVPMENIGLVEHLYVTDSVLHGELLQKVKTIVFDRVTMDDLQISTENKSQFDLRYVHISNCQITSTQIQNLFTLMKTGSFTIVYCYIIGSKITLQSDSIDIKMQSNTYKQ